MAYVKGINRIKNADLFYHGTSLKAWTGSDFQDWEQLHLTNDETEAEHYGEETSESNGGDPVVIAEISGKTIKMLHGNDVIHGIFPDSNWSIKDEYDDEDEWYKCLEDQGIIMIDGNIREVKKYMTYKMYHAGVGDYISLSYDEFMAVAEQKENKGNIMENFDSLKSVFLLEELDETMDEMAYPDSWSWDTFKSLNNYAQRVKYCEQHLQKLGSGSSRIAFKVDDDKVLKIAKNKKGLEQNEAEARLYFDGYIQNSGYDKLLSKVHEVDDEYLWLEMDLLTKVKPTEFRKFFGVDVKEVDGVIRAIDNRMGRNRSQYGEPKSSIYDQFISGELEESNPELYELVDLCQELVGNFNYSIGDFGRLSSYGKTKDGRIVVVDYGLTWDIYEMYYSPNRKKQNGGRYGY